MATITLNVELPEELAARWETLSADDKYQYTTAAAAAASDILTEAIEDYEADPELIAALQEGIAEARTGHVLTLEEMDMAFEQRRTQVLARMRKTGSDA